MVPQTVHIKSFGCQMNKLDTALVRSALEDAGYGITGSVEEADVVLINTCSVREHAEQRVLSHLGHLKHVRQNRPELIVGVIGCMAQRLGAELLGHKAVDIVCGPAQIPRITTLIAEAMGRKKKTLAVTDGIRHSHCDDEAEALERFESIYGAEDRQIPAQAFVRVMRGCNKFCSYCVVPYVRGPEVSRPPAAVTEQVRRLAGQGVKLVTLLGQAVNSYRYSAGEKTYCLADLLEMASEVEGIEWIRFVTSYPSKEFFDEITSAMADLPKVCNYLHMPAQSGSDKVLQAMSRRYTAREYLELVERARNTVEGIAVSGDFIVGFPGETEADFRATVELVKETQYKNCFIFKYSPRPGTNADKENQDSVPAEVKRQRNMELLELQNQISAEQNKRFLNHTVKVLVEGPSKKPQLDAGGTGEGPQLVGRTATDHIVVFNGGDSLAGHFARVEITRTSALTLFGELLRAV